MINFEKASGRHGGHPSRGFRLHVKRFAVRVLRNRFLHSVGYLLSKCKFSCHRALQLLLLKKKLSTNCNRSASSNADDEIKTRKEERRLRLCLAAAHECGNGRSSSPYVRSSSVLYSEEAISECLEYIRTSAALSISRESHRLMVSPGG